jgi:hypothetical protein
MKALIEIDGLKVTLEGDSQQVLEAIQKLVPSKVEVRCGFRFSGLLPLKDTRHTYVAHNF